MTPQPMTTESTDHRPYIETVRVALLLRDIHVGVATFRSRRLRSAAMTLLAPADDVDEPWHSTFTNADQVELRWSEEEGWSLLALHSHGDAQLPTIWRRGFGVVLPPDEIRSWLALLLSMPAFAASQDDGPYRSHQLPDAEFEAALAAYGR